VGRKKIDLNYEEIGQEYLLGNDLISLGKKYKVSQWTLLDRFKELGVRKTTKRTLNKKAFSIFTSQSCYWAGFIAADGWVNKVYRLGVELSFKDKDHLIKLGLFLQSNAEIKSRSRKNFGKIQDYCYVCFNSSELVKDLETNFNIITNKSLIYQFPELPTDMIRHFIRGYIDGDGSIGWHKHNNKPRLNICSGSKKLLEWIFKQFQTNMENIGNPSIIKRKNSNLYTIEFMGLQVITILDWIYKDTDIYLDRKYLKFKDLNG